MCYHIGRKLLNDTCKDVFYWIQNYVTSPFHRQFLTPVIRMYFIEYKTMLHPLSTDSFWQTMAETPTNQQIWPELSETNNKCTQWMRMYEKRWKCSSFVWSTSLSIVNFYWVVNGRCCDNIHQCHKRENVDNNLKCGLVSRSFSCSKYVRFKCSKRQWLPLD